MREPTADDNKEIVREAFDTLFNRRDYTAAERFWSAEYIQHSAHIPPGRDSLFDLIRSRPPTLRHELELITADGEMVMVRGRSSGHGLPAPLDWWWTPFALEGGLLKEHWDVVEDEASRDASASGLPMFGDRFPKDR